MGESITKTTFRTGDIDEFRKRLRQETLLLKKGLEQRVFEYVDKPMMGLEVEAWLVDHDFIPSPSNKAFLELCQNKDFCEEISKFNFEINTNPSRMEGLFLSKLHQELREKWNHCQEKAGELKIHPFLVGIHPLVRDEMLQPEYMSDGKRYQALNDQIFHFRKNAPIRMDIQGQDHFEMSLDSILIEAAATSIQVHIQANQENFRRVYNASLIASTPCVAVAANSPFLYGHDLWDESRIPLFEQAIALKQFRDKKGLGIGRVSFGTGYIKHSLLELFLENLDGFSPLLPMLFDEEANNLHHLRFHNGTLWRWNRPIIGFESEQPNLRVEQRVMASGPTLVDIVANTAFAIGLTHYLATQEKVPEESMTFTDCRNNFYSAAQHGLGAEVRWFGKKQRLDQLILEDLLPKAEQGLASLGTEKADIKYYLKEIIRPRVLKGQNGAKWQRAFVETHGKDFQALSQTYFEWQQKGVPVHQWTI